MRMYPFRGRGYDLGVAVVADGSQSLTAEELAGALRAVDSSAVLVPAWFLERLIARDPAVAGGVFVVPRVAAQVVSRARLMEFSKREELPLESTPPECETLLLLARPDLDVLAGTPGPELLLLYWRMAFHARVRAEVRRILGAESDSRAGVQRRIERLGRTLYHEARFVLVREKYLMHSADEADSYAEFAALFLEFTFFAPELVPTYFPYIEDVVHVAAAVGEGIDPDGLLKGTRPAGAADRHHPKNRERNLSEIGSARLKKRATQDAPKIERLLKDAQEADEVGNDVRAAIYRMRVYRASGTAAFGASRDPRTTVYAEALKDLDQLVSRLRAALGLEESVARQWRAWLGALLENAAGGWWNAEGRLLYDLQKVCVYHEREIYSVNLVDWALELGRRPLKRPQPGQRLVLMTKALRSALGRTGRVRLSSQARDELVKLLQGAVDIAEARLREFLRPRVEEAINEAGIEPSTASERVAGEKLLEELLDEAVAKGYLTFGALRDAVSRNQMKLNDIAQVEDLARGDQLLQLDRRMEERLDYVYHRAEIYLKWFHRLSSLFFATITGRFLTKWLILPFGGAFLILEALDHSVGKLIHHVSSRTPTVRGLATSTARDITGALAPTHTEAAKQATEFPPIFTRPWVFVLLGLFLLGVINLPWFRRAAGNVFRQVWRMVRLVIADFPKWLATRPLVKRVFASRAMRVFGRYVVKPLIFVGLVFLFIPPGVSLRAHVVTMGLAFLAVNLAINSRAGRAFEQAVLHSIRTTVARFGWEILVALFRGIMNLFEAMLEAIDRLLYAVDEMLRFRAGQGGGAVAAKAILGVMWFYVAYVTRFVINLLVEPQINPIKHFPVVTVSHKMLLPTIPFVSGVLQTVGVSQGRAIGLAGAIVTSIPGIFGFLAWEFKENWKLYKANRPRSIKPVRVGSHGETVASFLRPGFHSGTVPKIFHRLRKARRRAEDWSVRRKPLRPGSEAKHLHSLEHVREEVAAFVRREFLALLNRHPRFVETPVALRAVRLAATTIRIDLEMRIAGGGNGASNGSAAGGIMTIRFEQRSGWVLAGVDAEGFAADLPADRREVFAAALLGLYKLAGVDVVEENVRARLMLKDVRFDLRRDQLVVWPGGDFSAEAVYDFDLPSEQTMAPEYRTPAAGRVPLPELRREQLVLRYVPLPRQAWAGLWEGKSEASGGVMMLPRVRVLAERSPAAEAARIAEVAAVSTF